MKRTHTSSRTKPVARGPQAPAARHPDPRPGRGGARPAASGIRIVVADHQAIDRGGVVGLLEKEPDLEVVGESATIEETIQQCRALAPDVLVLSLNLPAQDRDAAIPTIRAQLPQLRILALSERGAENCLVLNPPSRQWLKGVPLGTCPVGIDCLQLAATQGAMATLRRSADPEDLYRAVRAVALGQAWYDPTTAAGMLSVSGRPNGTAGRPLFSDREIQVAALIAEGQSNKEISTSLVISEPTVKKHVGHILEKLGLADRLQAGLYLARNPLLFRR
jgi:DNA-binding NarL/FixJ family response regulator